MNNLFCVIRVGCHDDNHETYIPLQTIQEIEINENGMDRIKANGYIYGCYNGGFMSSIMYIPLLDTANIINNLPVAKSTPIEKLNFSARVYNSLKKANIYTLQDIISKSNIELSNIRGIGENSLNEINEKRIYRLHPRKAL